MGKSTNKGLEKRALYGISIGATLAIVFGSFLVIAGSITTWADDPVLGLLSKKGIEFRGISPSDGIITLVLGALSFAGLAAVIISKSKRIARIPVAIFAILFIFSLFEILNLLPARGILSPGRGIYMILGGSVAGFLCSLSCYNIIADSISRQG